MSGFSRADLATLHTLLAAAAAQEIMPRFQRLPAAAIRTKTGPLDLVTDADEAAERLIERGLAQHFPGALVVGEEAVAADPALPARLAGARLAFVVDPIDGTANYAAGLPLFGSMAAAIIDGTVAAAVILDPVTGQSFCALAGQGAWREAPGVPPTPLRVAAPAPFTEMTGTLSWRLLPAPGHTLSARGAMGFAGLYDFRCAAHQYRLIAAGHLHFSVYNRLMPWDHAPGWLIHREAGGYSARFDGSPYTPLESRGGLILAPDVASWGAIRGGIFTA